MSRDGLVWSSDRGRTCPGCERAVAQCVCGSTTSGGAGDGVVRVARQTKGRRGKGVTVVTGLALPPTELARLAKDLKRRCGSGGTVKDGTIEIQGEHRDALVDELTKRGFTVKRVGG